MRERSFFRVRAAVTLVAAGCLYLSLSVQAASGLDQARGLVEEGNREAAVVELKGLLRQDPGHRAARLLLGEVYLTLRSGADAERELRRAAELGADPASWRLRMLDAMLLQGKFSDMLDLLEDTDETGDPKVLSDLAARRGRALSGLARHTEAEMAFSEALELDPDNEQAAMGHILLRLQQDGRADVAGDTDRFLARYPDNVEILIARAELFRRAADLDDALGLFTRAAELDPGDFRPAIGRASLLVSKGELAAAKAALDHADGIRADLAITQYLRGFVAFQEQDWAAAKTYLERVLEVIPGDLQSRMLLGAVSFSVNELQNAEEHLSRVVAGQPDNLHAIGILAATRIKLREAGRAIELLRRVVPDSGDAQLMALLGSAYMLDGDDEAGQEWLRRSVETSPDTAALRVQLAMALLAGGDTDRAVEELQTAVALEQGGVQADVLLILTYLKSGRHDRAVEAGRAMEQRHGDKAVPYNLTGLAYLSQGEIDLAAERFHKALGVDPGFAPAIMNLARVDVARNDTDMARARYETVLAKEPTHLAAMLGLAALAERGGDTETMRQWLERAWEANPNAAQPGLALAAHHLNSGDVLKGLSLARDLSGRFPNDAEVLEVLARAQILGGDPSRAVRTLERLAGQQPDNHLVYHLIGGARFKAEDYAGARLAFQRAMELKPDFADATYALAVVAMREGRVGEALEIARRLGRDFPSSALGAGLEGRIHLDQNRPDEAAKALETAQALEPTSDTLVFLSTAYARDDRRREAIDLLERWSAEHPEDARALAILAQLLQTEGRAADAARAYEALIGLGQKNYVILNNLAWLYEKLGDERAVEVAREAYDLEPNRPEVADTYGWLLVQSGKTRAGLAILQQAYVAYPTQSEIGYHVAVGLKKEARHGEAVKVLRRLLRETPDFQQADEARALLAELEASD